MKRIKIILTVTISVLLLTVSNSAMAFWPWVFGLLGRSAIVEESMVARGAAERSAATRSVGSKANSRQVQKDFSWAEKEAGKQIIKKVVNGALNQGTDASADARSECLVVSFDGNSNHIFNTCTYPIELRNGWVQIVNMEEVIEYTKWAFARINQYYPNSMPTDDSGDTQSVASWWCTSTCIVRARQSFTLEPVTISANSIALYPTKSGNSFQFDHSILEGRSVKYIGPIVAMQYRRI